MVVDGDYMVPGKVASKWNKSAEELRKWLYNMAIKFHNTKNRRNGPPCLLYTSPSPRDDR